MAEWPASRGCAKRARAMWRQKKRHQSAHRADAARGFWPGPDSLQVRRTFCCGKKMETWIQWITKASRAQSPEPCPSDRAKRAPGQQKGYFHRIGPTSRGGLPPQHLQGDLEQGSGEDVARQSRRRVAALGNSPHYLYIRLCLPPTRRPTNKKARRAVPEGPARRA